MKRLRKIRIVMFVLCLIIAFSVTANAASLSASISPGSYYLTSAFSVSNYVHIYQGTSAANVIYYLYSTTGDVVGASEYISGVKRTDVTKDITKYGTNTQLCAYNTDIVNTLSLSGRYYADTCSGESSYTHVEKY